MMDIRYMPKEEFLLLWVSWLIALMLVVAVVWMLYPLYESVTNWVRERGR